MPLHLYRELPAPVSPQPHPRPQSPSRALHSLPRQSSPSPAKSPPMRTRSPSQAPGSLPQAHPYGAPKAGTPSLQRRSARAQASEPWRRQGSQPPGLGQVASAVPGCAGHVAPPSPRLPGKESRRVRPRRTPCWVAPAADRPPPRGAHRQPPAPGHTGGRLQPQSPDGKRGWGCLTRSQTGEPRPVDQAPS